MQLRRGGFAYVDSLGYLVVTRPRLHCVTDGQAQSALATCLPTGQA